MKSEHGTPPPPESGSPAQAIEALRAWLDHPTQHSPAEARERVTRMLAPRPALARSAPWRWLAAAVVVGALLASVGRLIAPASAPTTGDTIQKQTSQRASVVVLELPSGTRLLVPIDTLSSGAPLRVPSRAVSRPSAADPAPPSEPTSPSKPSPRSLSIPNNRKETS